MIMMDPLSRERLKDVTVEWSYPKTLDNLWYDDRIYDFGLYYISRKFGAKETLLYIGKTHDSYYNRLAAHQYNWLSNYRGKKYIRLGTVTYPVNKRDDEMKQLIKDVESALIYEMRDTLMQNTMGIGQYTPAHLYRVTNIGYRGELSAEVSMRDHLGGIEYANA